MGPKLGSIEQAVKVGTKVGSAMADMLRIEVVCAYATRTEEVLDECQRVRGPFDRDISGPRADCGDFAEAFDTAWWDGLRGRCGDIVDRLNRNSLARLPEHEYTGDEWDGD